MIDALNAMYEWMVSGSYNFVQEIFAQLIIWVVTWYFKIKAAALAFTWGIAQGVIAELNLSALIDQYWGTLDSNLIAFATRYNVPEALNMILNACVTRFIWNMI